jgi:lysophospholipase L1-like esterase
MRRRLVIAAALSLVASVVPGAAAAGAPAPRVTFVGDSVAASLDYAPAARALLARGLDLRLDLQVCRRLVQRSCTFQRSTPPTALEAVRALGPRLGDALVVQVGHNEGPEGYGRGIDRVMRAALANGANGVVWVTLREANPLYRGTNRAIRAAARRWPQLLVADWNAASRGRPWFGDDGLHLNVTGATALAAFLRPFALRAARA